jgi:hypothetical protein
MAVLPAGFGFVGVISLPLGDLSVMLCYSLKSERVGSKGALKVLPSATVGRILTTGKSNKTAKLATLSSSEGLEGSTDTLTTPNQELSHHLQEFTTN